MYYYQKLFNGCILLALCFLNPGCTILKEKVSSLKEKHPTLEKIKPKETLPGQLKFIIQPDDAEIYLNSKSLSDKGASFIINILPGEYKIRISHPKYLPKERIATVSSGQTTLIEIALEPNFGFLSISSNPKGVRFSITPVNVNISLEEYTIPNTTPAKINLPPGAYTVTLSKGNEYKSINKQILIDRGKETNLMIDLPLVFGKLNISTEPKDAMIYLDGKLVGEKRPSVLENILPGKHRIRVERPPKYLPKEELVIVLGGKTLNIFIQLESNFGTLGISSEPVDADISIVSEGKNKRISVNKYNTPAKIELLPGTYMVSISKEKHEPVTIRVSIERRKIVNLGVIKLLPKFGTLEVSTDPETMDISISSLQNDFVKIKKTPFLPMELAPGKYSIIFSKGRQYESIKREVIIHQGIPTKLDTVKLPMKIESWKYQGKFAKIPSGWFDMGSQEGMKEERPVHRVFLDEYWVGRHEVTVAEYTECVKAGGCKEPIVRDKNSECNWGKVDYKDHPINCVSWDDAKAYSDWYSQRTGLKFRLPTEAEWEKAAKGTQNRKYPWGNQWNGSKANFCDKNCPKHWKDSLADDGYPTTAPVRLFENGKSPYGVYHMIGNVREWCIDCYDGNFYYNSSEKEPINKNQDNSCKRVVRGGSWDVFPKYMTTTFRYKLPHNERHDSVGFRLIFPSKNIDD